MVARSTGPEVEGRIKGGSSGSLMIQDSNTGAMYAIPRSEIREIDHPGNVAATLGGVATGYGLLNVMVGLEDCRNEERFSSNTEQNAFCAGLFAPLAIGAGLLIYGISVYSGSKSRAADTSLEMYAPDAPTPNYDPYGPRPPMPPPWGAPASAAPVPGAAPPAPPAAAPAPAVPPTALPPAAAPPAAAPPPTGSGAPAPPGSESATPPPPPAAPSPPPAP